MRAGFVWSCLLLVGAGLFPSTARAVEEFFRAEIVTIEKTSQISESGNTFRYHTVAVKLIEGENAGNTISIPNVQTHTSANSPIYQPGDVAVVVFDGENYQLIDHYRLDKIALLVVSFFVLVILLSRLKGLGSILGMFLSLLTVVKFIIPRILAGQDPVLITILGAFFIMTVTIFLAHGFSRRTIIALISTYLCLISVGILATLSLSFAHLSGLGTEEAYGLQFGPTASINPRGLLLAGIIVGALGVLDDITTSLSATVFEVAKANPSYNFSRLIKSGLEVGREHISSLVNTLVLAYAGASLPIFLYLVLNVNSYPLWFILNSENIMEEVIRTLSGSVGLILAVPLTALMAAWSASKTHAHLAKA